MEVIQTISHMHQVADQLRNAGDRVGLVPTMGYLHEGHLSLITRALEDANQVVVSIFVNPTQFGPKEDLAAYPRDLDRDLDLIEKAGAKFAYVPEVEEVYPEGFATYVNVEGLTDNLCGISRPEHFKGVTTIVSKLFAAVKPHLAVFGQKDAQQVLVIQRMVRDLNFDVEVVVAPTVREADGVAKSSRNVYLTPEERQDAPALYRALQKGKALIEAGVRDPEEVVRTMRAMINATPYGQIDYVEAVDMDQLAPMSALSGQVLLAVAVYFGKARLIDNVWVEVPRKTPS
ncbi:MAG: pantoate--beta-alanine ligase [Candidatus Latescibacteria bacterium]|nr:pantoate--beta-alanine ligase [Candidatus Latescibacterota bacterium]MBT5830484.1 pantoate--beta-alanine ligase [Candidatus Latescibacterota bacterium]